MVPLERMGERIVAARKQLGLKNKEIVARTSSDTEEDKQKVNSLLKKLQELAEAMAKLHITNVSGEDEGHNTPDAGAMLYSRVFDLFGAGEQQNDTETFYSFQNMYASLNGQIWPIIISFLSLSTDIRQEMVLRLTDQMSIMQNDLLNDKKYESCYEQQKKTTYIQQA